MKQLKLDELIKTLEPYKSSEIYESVLSSYKEVCDAQNKIKSLQKKVLEERENILKTIKCDEDFFFNSNLFVPLKPIRKLFQKPNVHRGGYQAALQYLVDKKYISNEGIDFVPMVDPYFMWDNGAPLEKPWIGVVHLTSNCPLYLENCDINKLFNNPNFQRSIKTCKGLVFLSQYMKDYSDKIIQKSFSTKMPTSFVKYPVGKDLLQFDLDYFLMKQNKKIIFIGSQMRRVSSLYFLKAPGYQKGWLSGKSNSDAALKLIKREMQFLGKKPFQDFDPSSVDLLHTSNWNQYDKIITSNIIFIDFYDASANTAINELIMSNTPAFIRRLPATEEYLGKDYPMFFDNLTFVETVISNPDYITDVYSRTYRYLQNMDKSDLSHEHFGRSLLRLIND
jgi:hypothetical protein